RKKSGAMNSHGAYNDVAVAVARMPDANGEVDAVGDVVDVSLGDQAVHGHLGIALLEGTYKGNDRKIGHARRHGYSQPARYFGLALRHLRIGRFELRQAAATRFEVVLADLGRPQLPG